MQKLWIFTFNRRLTESEYIDLNTRLNQLLLEWTAHKVSVPSQVRWEANQLLVVEALSNVSGCGIDWLTQQVQMLANEFQLHLCSPTTIPVFQPDEGLSLMPLPDLITALRNGQISPDTLMYDSTVVHQNTLEGWKKSLADSWVMARV